MKSSIESTSTSLDTRYGTTTKTTLKAIPFFHRLVYPLVLPGRSWVGNNLRWSSRVESGLLVKE
jgi:hypothetical protein